MDPPPPASPANLSDVTPNPVPAAITAQSTSSGRALHVAHVATDDGHLLFPYGDYGTNTGPIDVIGYRPADGNVVTYYDNLTDERIEDYRRLDDGRFVTCNTDPQGRNPAVILLSGPGGAGPWTPRTVQVPGSGVAVHQFDVDQVNGALYAAVARNYTAAEMAMPGANPDPEANTGFSVWKSVDDGINWTEDLVELKNGDGYYRPYGFGRVGNRLVVSASDSTGYWILGDNGVWSAKITTGDRPSISSPCLYHPDRLSFAAAGNGGVTWKLNSAGTALERIIFPYPGFQRAIGVGPAGWLWVNATSDLSYGSTPLGRLPKSGFQYRGVVDPDGTIFISDGTQVLLVEQP